MGVIKVFNVFGGKNGVISFYTVQSRDILSADFLSLSMVIISRFFVV
jgi:hypothetical protein